MASSLAGALTNLPDTLRSLAAAPEPVGLPDHEAIQQVLVIADGDDATDAELVAAVASPLSPVPVLVHRGYALPSFVDAGTLVVAASARGDSDETAEVFDQARRAGAATVVIAGPGALADTAAEGAVPFIEIPEGCCRPRALPGVIAVPLVGVLDRAGMLPGGDAWVEDAIAQLEVRLAELAEPTSPARLLARRIGRTMPLIYSGGELGGPIGRWWKSACNQGAKLPAFTHVVPDLCHDELAGFGQAGDVTRQVFTVVMLRHDHEPPQVVELFVRLPEQLDEVVSGIEWVQAKGDGPLAQALDLAIVGQKLSIELADVADVDPGPVPIIDELFAAVRGHNPRIG